MPSIARLGLASSEEADARPPLTAEAKFVLAPGVGFGAIVGVGLGAMFGVGLGTTGGVGLGVTFGVGDGTELVVPPPHASSSTTRLYPSAVELTTTRIRDVVIGENTTLRTTVLFPETPPLGTFTHAEPFQY